MSLYQNILRPLAFMLPAETAHRAAINALRSGAFATRAVADPVLETNLAGLNLASPIGMAAGFDKDAEVPEALLAAGFGFAEVGSITPLPQPGNPKPRVFRLPADNAVINRLGFNNGGMEAAAKRLAALPPVGARRGPIGVNIGANKLSTDPVQDYFTASRRLAGYGDYLVVNISSPNTPGLRDLQAKEGLCAVIAATQDGMREAGVNPPLFVKIAPDLNDATLDDILDVATNSGLGGLIVSNTTIARPESLSDNNKGETGGLSGAPLFAPSTTLLATVARRLNGALPIIGVGGVFTADDAYQKLSHGASAVQLYTGMVYRGPGIAATINRGLAKRLRAEGVSNLSEIVGSAL